MSDAELRSERRFASQFNDGKDMPVQVRAAGGDRLTIGGYAAKFDRMSQNLGGFKERIAPGFFNYSRSQGWPGMLARYNHDDNMLLGTTGAQTLRLDIDSVGLMYDVDLPASRADVYELVQRGDVRQSSFAFIADEDEWDTIDNFPRRTLITGRSKDVAPVNTPAYLDTSAAQRALTEEARSVGGALVGPNAAFASLARKMDADVAEVRKAAEDNELMRFFKVSGGPGTMETKRSSQAALAKALSLK